jgi:hypothetical protein
MQGERIPLLPESVPHYHGDKVRRLFIASAALSLIVIPLWGNILPFGMAAQISAALLLVLLAGFTNPHGRFWIACDIAIAAVSVFLLESAAIIYFHTDSSVLFFAREAEAILLLFALYYGVKTLRAMLLHTVGAEPTEEEFEQKPEVRHDVRYY